MSNPSDEIQIPAIPMTAAEFDIRIHAANARMAEETRLLDESNKALRDLVSLYRAHAAHLEATLAQLQAERNRIDAQARRLLSTQEQALLEELLTP